MKILGVSMTRSEVLERCVYDPEKNKVVFILPEGLDAKTKVWLEY